MEQRIASICSQRRSTSEESKAQWKVAEELCISIKKKMCTTCTQVLPFEMFHKDASGFCGKRNRCNSCYGRRVVEIKNENVDQKVKRQCAPKATVVGRIEDALKCAESMTRYEIESSGCEFLKQCKSMEIRFWQDGTLSDAGVRPVNSVDDMWLPMQLKSTAKKTAPYTFNGCDSYGSMLMIGTIGTGCAIVLDKSECFSNGQIKKNKLSVPLNIDELGEIMHSKFDEARVRGLLSSEMHLRMQCSLSNQVELALMQMSSLLVDKTCIQWPDTRNSVVDRIISDNVRVQDKAAYKCNTAYKGSVMKKFRGGHIPYLISDCDLFVFSTVHTHKRLLIEWRIPSSWLAQQGYLTVVGEDGVVATHGKLTQIALGIDPLLKAEIFEKPFLSGQEKDTIQFCNVHPIPLELHIEACLYGRE